MVRRTGDGGSRSPRFWPRPPRRSHICEQIRPVVSAAGVSIQRVVWPALGNGLHLGGPGAKSLWLAECTLVASNVVSNREPPSIEGVRNASRR